MLPFDGTARRLRALLWPLLAGLGAVVPPAWILLSGHTLVWRDTAQLNAALRPMIVESLRAGRLPAWNPWEGTGQPVFAQLLHGVLNPVSVAVAILTPSTDALIVALVLFASTGTWLAARALGASGAAAAGAALAFALSGYGLSMADNTSYLIPTATGPWAVAGLVAAARRPAGWVAAAAAVAALALSGDPGSLFAFTLVGACLAWVAGRWRGLILAGLGAALGFALAAIQYVPAWLYLADTARGAGRLDPGDLHRWALAWWRLVELVSPGFFVGVPRSYQAPVFAALDGATPDRFPFTPSVFVGATVLLLAALGTRRNRNARWLVGLAALFLWFALGHRAGSQALLAGMPVWGVLRYWEKMVGPLTLCLALAAGLGIDAVAEDRARAASKMAGFGAGLALVAALALLLPGASRVFCPDEHAANVAAQHLRVGLLHAALGLALLSAVLSAGSRWSRSLRAALAVVVFLQSAAASPFALHAGQPAALRVRPPALAAPPPGPRLVGPLGCDYLEGLGDFDAIDLLNMCERRTARPSTNVEFGVNSIFTYSSLTPGRWDLIMSSRPLFWQLARRFGNSHVVAYAPTSEAEVMALEAATAGATGLQAMDQGRLLVWDVPHRAWAFFATTVRIATSKEEAHAALAEEISAARETVVVESRARLSPLSGGRVISIRRGAETVELEAESQEEGLLVVNDAWAPGWKAAIDGVEAELMPADVLVRSVRWPAGRHRLVMKYEMPGLVAGAIISGLALAVGMAAFVWQRRRSAPRASTTPGPNSK